MQFGKLKPFGNFGRLKRGNRARQNRTFGLFLILIFSVLTFIACGEEKGGKAPSGAPKEAKGKKGGLAARVLQVEGYQTKYQTIASEFKTAGELRAFRRVDLRAESSGRLVKLAAKDGGKVSKGLLLAKIDDSELRAQKKQAEATAKQSGKNLERIKSLHEKGSATEVELENAESEYERNSATKELLDAQISKTELRAPFAGLCGILNVTEGEWISSGSVIATLSDVSKLRVRFMLPQRHASGVKLGGEIFLRDEERGVVGTGKIFALDPVLSESSRSRAVEAEISNAQGEWLAGSFVSIVVPLTAAVTPTFSIPAEGVTLDDKGAYVYVVKSGKAVRTYVKTGLRTPISVTVTEGLAEGDTVAVSGLMNLRDGASVELKGFRNNETYEVSE